MDSPMDLCINSSTSFDSDGYLSCEENGKNIQDDVSISSHQTFQKAEHAFITHVINQEQKK